MATADDVMAYLTGTIKPALDRLEFQCTPARYPTVDTRPMADYAAAAGATDIGLAPGTCAQNLWLLFFMDFEPNQYSNHALDLIWRQIHKDWPA